MINEKQKLLLPVPMAQAKEEPKENYSTQKYVEEETSTIEPLRIIFKKDYRQNPPKITESMLLKCGTTGKNATKFITEVQSSDFADKKSFKSAIFAYTANINIDLKEKEFSQLRKNWYDKAEQKTIYACPGLQNGKFIWANAYHDIEIAQTSYAERTDETKGYDCVENSLVDMQNSCQPMLYPIQKDLLLLLREFFTIFCRTFPNSEVLACFGMALAIVFWDIFQKETQGFPTIYFVGEHHSGKSTLLWLLAAIYGFVNSSQLTSGDSTPFAINKKLSSRICIPVFLEELASKILADLEPLVKNSYSGLSRARGKKDDIEEMQIFTSFVGTSNDFFPKVSGQLLSRIVFANMKKGQFDLTNFPYFDIEKRKELSQILPIFLRCRSKIIPIYKQIYSELDKLIPNKGRHISNLAISCSIWYLVNALMGYELVNWRQIAIDYNEMYQSYLNTELQTSDVILNDITRMVEAERLDHGTDWKLVKGSILRLNLNRYIEKYNVANPQTMMSPAQFRQLVATDRRFDTKTVVMKGLNRAISIDVSGNEYLLEKLQFQQGAWSAINENTDNDEN